MSLVTQPLGNHLIAALSELDRQAWSNHLERVAMPIGQVLYESGCTMDYVYFPVTAVVSLLYVTEGGSTSELAVVGNEGVVGISQFMGGGSTSSRGVVQCGGEGFRMRAPVVRAYFDNNASIQLLLLKYTQSLLTQMSQTAVCNRHHSLEAQLCRRLLLTLDRVEGSSVMMTQELLANMLGVRREGVSVAAFRLQRDGVIRYSRGCIDVLDRAALELRTCECYAVVKRECDRLLPDLLPTARPAGVPAQAFTCVPATFVEAPRSPALTLVAAATANSVTPRKAFEAARRRRAAAVDPALHRPAAVDAFQAMSRIMSSARWAAAAVVG